ncbi:MAG: beta-propeller fold lactonase family protein [Ilumatobacteraceae bacterium]
MIALLAPIATLTYAGTASADDGHHDRRGRDHDTTTIYAETNDAAANQVLAIQNVDGALMTIGSYSTGGLGSGAGLGSQGAVVSDGDHLLAVNAGSNQVSLFKIQRDGGLTLGDVQSSGGLNPVSVAVHDDIAYVVNAGDSTISGFRIHHDGLEPIVGSTQLLTGSGAAQVSFDTQGKRLVVTEKATSTIDVFAVNRRGVAGAATPTTSAGQTPFGFAIDGRNHVIVSNAVGGAAAASSVSSYRFADHASLEPISPEVTDTQTAACWIALSENEKYAYTTNTGSGSISSYRVARNGSLQLVQAIAASPGVGPTDMVEADGSLFTLNNGSHTITAHSIGDDGSLTINGQVSVPPGTAGLAMS